MKIEKQVEMDWDYINYCPECEIEGIYLGWYHVDGDEGEDIFKCSECGFEWFVLITAEGELIEH